MKIDISHIAKLANLPLSSTEKAKFEKQLGETLEYIEGLNEIETKNTEPTSQVTGLENITREDIAKTITFPKEALSNSKSTHNGFLSESNINRMKLNNLNIKEARKGLENKDFSSLDLTKACLDQIKKLEGETERFCHHY